MKSAAPEQKVQEVSKVRQILVVEDEQPIREMVAYALRRAGFEVTEAGTSHDAKVKLADQRPDLMLVDWMLPDMSGLELTRQVKRDPQTRDVPIIMLTARAAEGDKVAGLDGGADDYVTKPFSPRELLSRINAVLRRSGTAEEGDRLQLAGLSMDRASHRVSHDNREVSLGPTEYRMLEFFMQNPERVYSRSQLLDRIWGGNVYIEERTIDVHIRRLRKALEEVQMDHLIQTVRGSGYRFSAREQGG
jgi:two-component system, OmpR family, phosphate regulon response regulator PhoB